MAEQASNGGGVDAQSPPPSASFPLNPEDFDGDERISFSKLDNKFVLVQSDGSEFEFDEALRRWIPVLDEALLEEQRRAYVVAGVDEEEPVEAARKKRKKEYVNGEDDNGRAVKAPKKQKAPLPPRENTAIYVTGLPRDATVEEVHEVFSRKCGVIAEEIDSGKPRIKLYTDEKGEFKGDALVVFFKAPSVQMAITLLDDTEFRFGDHSSGHMRVQAADSSYKKVQAPQTQQPGDADKEQQQRPKTSLKDKQKIIKKTQKLDARLADWDDDEPAALLSESSRWDKVVILKHMFTLQELDEDPAALLDIKEDIRGECAKLGDVTNVVLFDGEEDGVASVRFASPEAARACVRLMDGRNFDGRVVKAYVSSGREQFRKRKQGDDDDEAEGKNEA